MGHKVHVFGIKPGTKGEDLGYAYPHWEPEPGEDASDDEYHAWEDRNPLWGLRQDLGCYLDSDFVEYFGNEDCDIWEYLSTYVKDSGDIRKIREHLIACRDLVLIFDSALGGHDVELAETEGALYAGEFDCSLGASDDGPSPSLQPGDHSGRILIARRVAPDLVVTAGRYGEVRFWDTNAASPIDVESNNSTRDFVHAISISKDHSAIYSCSDEVLHWDLLSRPITSRLLARHGGYQIGDIGLVRNQHLLAIACVDKTVGLIDLESGQEDLLTHEERVTSLVPLPDNEHLVTVTSKATMETERKESDAVFSIWNVQSRKKIRAAKSPLPITRLILLQDSETLLYGTEIGRLIWWDWRSSGPARCVDAHDDGWVNAIEISGDGQLAITAGDKTAKVWRVSDGELVALFDGHMDEVKAACFVDTDHVATGGRDATIRVWRISDQTEIARFTDAPSSRPEIPSYLDDPWEIHCLVADDKSIVAGETSGRVRILRYEDEKLHLLR